MGSVRAFISKIVGLFRRQPKPAEPAEADRVRALLAAAKEAGCTSFQGAGIKVTFAAPKPEAANPARPPDPHAEMARQLESLLARGGV